jgi:PAS domain-containing protein
MTMPLHGDPPGDPGGVPGEPGSRPAPAGHPAAFHDGAAHIIRWANPPFAAMFGAPCVGLPAREAMTGLGRAGFQLMDRVLREGRPLARRVGTPDGERRLVVVPRRDIETGEVYGVATHLRKPDAT